MKQMGKNVNSWQNQVTKTRRVLHIDASQFIMGLCPDKSSINPS